MKNLLLSFCISATLLLTVNSADAQIDLTKSYPKLYIDSVKVNYFLLEIVDPMDIDSLNVTKAVPNGALHIKLKDHSKLKAILAEKMLSLGEISKKYVATADLRKPRLFFIDKDIVTDTAGFRIPSSKIVSVTVKSASDSPYLKGVLPNGLLIYISKQKLDQVRIRGGIPSR